MRFVIPHFAMKKLKVFVLLTLLVFCFSAKASEMKTSNKTGKIEFNSGNTYILKPKIELPLYFFIDISAVAKVNQASENKDSFGMFEEMKNARRAYQISGGKLKFTVLSFKGELIEIRIIDDYFSSLYTSPRPFRNTLNYQRGFISIEQANAIALENFTASKSIKSKLPSPIPMPNPFANPLAPAPVVAINPTSKTIIGPNNFISKKIQQNNFSYEKRQPNEAQKMHQLEIELEKIRIEKARITNNLSNTRVALNQALEVNKSLSSEIQKVKEQNQEKPSIQDNQTSTNVFQDIPDFDSKSYLNDTAKRLRKVLGSFSSNDIEVGFSFEIWQDGVPHNIVINYVSPVLEPQDKILSTCEEAVKAAGPFRSFSLFPIKKIAFTSIIAQSNGKLVLKKLAFNQAEEHTSIK